MSVYCRYAIMKEKECLGEVEVSNDGKNAARVWKTWKKIKEK